MTRISLITVLVDNYDEGIEFFVGTLGFELIEDSAAFTTKGESKRWVVVSPTDGTTGILLAQPDGADQAAAVGNQVGGRVGFFLNVDDFDETHERMVDGGVEFLETPREESYGKVVVFKDISGNKWDLIGPV